MTRNIPGPVARQMAHIVVGGAAVYVVGKVFRPGPVAQLTVAVASVYLHERLDAPLASTLSSIRW